MTYQNFKSKLDTKIFGEDLNKNENFISIDALRYEYKNLPLISLIKSFRFLQGL